MAQGAFKITEQFEQELSKYTGAPYVVCVDNASNALFLALYYEFNVRTIGKLDWWDKKTIGIPKHVYPSVPCEIIHAGGKVQFMDTYTGIWGVSTSRDVIKGAYCLEPTRVWDAALTFTSGMYLPKTHMCLSFTGPFKRLKLGKGGAILTDDEKAYKWFKKARFSGRDECSYHDDDFDKDPVIGWNFYMPVETAARGLHMMPQFYNKNGTPRQYEDLELPYPDLSKFKCYK